MRLTAAPGTSTRPAPRRGAAPGRRTRRRHGALLACLAAVAGLAGGCERPAGPPVADADTPYEVERHRETFALAGDGAIAVANRFGDLRIRSAKGGEPLLAAVVQRLRGEDRPIDFLVESDGTTASIDVSAPRDLDGRIDLVVLIPDGARIDAEATYGLLEVRVKSRAVRARTDSGRIYLRTDGHADAVSRAGDIDVSLQDASNWTETTTLASKDGVISIFTPVARDLFVDLDAEAIDNQMPERARFEIEDGARGLRGRLNAGTLAVHARAPNGTIKLIGF